jgi:hypothetical protein
MSSPRILVTVNLQKSDDDFDRVDQSVVLRLDVFPDDTELFGVRRSERFPAYVIEAKRITFDGQNRKAGGLFRSLEPGGELRNHLMAVHVAWTTDVGGLVSACESVCNALHQLPAAEWQ